MQSDAQLTPAPGSADPAAASSQPATPEFMPDMDLSTGERQALQEAYENGIADAPSAPSEPTADPAAQAVPEAVQEPDAEGDDEPAAETDSTEPKLSRAQRAQQRQDEAIAAAVARELSARDQATQAQAALAAKIAEDERIGSEVLAMVGTPDDENALIDKVASGDFEAADQLKQLRANKSMVAKIAYFERQRAYADLMPQLWTAKSLVGVDATVIDGVKSFSEALAHVSAAAVKATAADYEGRLERQKADYESRLGRAASGMPTTETGGRAVGAPARTFTREQIAQMDTATYKRNKAAIYEQEARGLIV